MSDTPASATQRATVAAAFGQHLQLRLADGQRLTVRAPRPRLTCVCADRVQVRLPSGATDAIVTALEARTTALYRSNARGVAEIIAANVTQLFVVCAPLPVPDFYIVDRYLAAADSAGCLACIVLNKTDAGLSEPLALELAAYERIGYRVLRLSARLGALEGLGGALSGQTSLFVGQSGVGKSSLLRALLPHSDARVGDLDRAEEGRHTTSAARLYELPDGGDVIDSPGVRDFVPAAEHLDPRTLGFREFGAMAIGCRFSDCRHWLEPGCAVRTAADEGTLHPRRYESYRRLSRLRERLLSAARGH